MPSARRLSQAMNMSSGNITIDVGANSFTTHCKSQQFMMYYCHEVKIFICPVCEAPSSSVVTNKEELMAYFKEMYTMRRMEISCDTEYKVNFRCITQRSQSILAPKNTLN
jgi:hypothetical protein